MKNDINLTPARSTIKRAYSRLFISSAIIFGGIFAVSLILIVYSFALKTRIKSLEQQAGALRSNISQHAVAKERLLVTAERLGIIRKVISSRKQLDIKVTSILSFIPASFGVETINADKDLISFRLASDNLQEFDRLLEEKVPSLTREKSLGLKKINITSFSEKGNNYVLSLDFNFGLTAKK